jgi:two-component system LytT family response regulator
VAANPQERTPLSVIIVDDEPIARQRIRRLLAHDSEIRIVGEFSSVADCARLDSSVTPDLVLLDVRMPDKDGFALLRSFEARGLSPFVIFVTAYSEYAVGAFDVEAVDYILKPFDDERFAKAIARAKALLEQERMPADDAPAADAERRTSSVPPRIRDRLLVTENGRVLFVPTSEIEMVQAAGKHVKIFVQSRCYVIRQPLRDIEERLDGNHFVRIHRSTIINVDQIVELHPLFHGDYEIVLKRGTRVTMSRRFRSRMLPFMVGPWPG